MTLTTLCKDINNYFDIKRVFDTFHIEDGALVEGLPLLDGQYYAIFDSVFNNGVHKQGDTLIDETFDGAIWLMAVPQDVIDLVNDITEWETANKAKINSPYTSESFGGYSYTKASGKNGTLSWQDIGDFSSRISRYRKICPY